MNNLAQLLALMNSTGGYGGDAGQNAPPSNGSTNWMQWLGGGMQGQPGAASAGKSNLSGAGTALAGSMGVGPLAGL